MNNEKISVLLIEDNPGDARLVQEMFSDAPGPAFELTHAALLSEGLELLGEGVFDVILLDLSLPDSSGPATFDKVRARTSLPVVLLTGLDDEGLASLLLGTGAQDYLVKGKVDVELLVRSVRYAIERHRVEMKQAKSEEELACTVVELRVSGEELKHQNDELVSSGRMLEGERARYRDLFESAPDGYVVSDAKGIIEDANLTAMSMLGLDMPSIRGKPMKVFIAPGCSEVFFENLDNLVSGGHETVGFEVSLKPAGGNPFPVSITAARGRLIDGEKPGIRWIIRNDTGRKEADEALRQSEERYRIIAENITDTVWLMDMDMRNTWVSRSATRLRGFTVEEINAMPLEKNFTPESASVALKAMAETLTGDNLADGDRQLSVRLELEFYKKDGSTFWGDVEMKLLRDAGGNPSGFLGVGRDITERRAAEEDLAGALEELSVSEEELRVQNDELVSSGRMLEGVGARYRDLFESAPDGYIVSDAKGTIEDANLAAMSMLGCNREFIRGKPMNVFLAPGCSEVFFANLGRVVARERETVSFETSVKPIGGNPFPVSVTAVSDRFIEGGKPGIRWIIRDDTDRRAAEEALRKSERRLMSAQEAAGIGSWEYDVDSSSIEWSEETHRLYERDPALGPPTEVENSVYYSDELAEALRRYSARAIADGKNFEYDFEVWLPGGRRAFYAATMRPVKDDGGRVISLTGTVQDITGRKSTEEALRRSNEELSGYAHTVSHDIKAPLSTVAAAADILSSILEGEGGVALEGDAGDALRIIGEGTRRALGLTDDLLALAQAGRAPAAREPVDISEVVRSVLREREALLEDRGARVSVEADLGVAAMDPTHARQVFSNLLGNAIEHNDGDNPEISVSRPGEAGPGRLRYLVRDNGPGIPGELLETLFTPFVKGEGGGTGIGLSIVDRVVRLYGGEVRARNDGGACFEFTLPAGS